MRVDPSEKKDEKKFQEFKRVLSILYVFLVCLLFVLKIMFF